MKKTTILILFLIWQFSFYAQTKNALPPKEIFACWKASYEETNEKTKTEIYRPCTYSKFRPSMFRLEIEFFIDGKCKFLRVGTTDNHYYAEGKWNYESSKKIITVLDENGKPTYKFALKKVSKDVLKTISLN